MSEENKSGVRVRWGWIIILAGIIFLLFKVDIKEKVESKQFKENISYIKNKINYFWDKYVVDFTKSKIGEVITNVATDSLKTVQENVTKNIKENFEDKE